MSVVKKDNFPGVSARNGQFLDRIHDLFTKNRYFFTIGFRKTVVSFFHLCYITFSVFLAYIINMKECVQAI